jgi:phosphomannomutase
LRQVAEKVRQEKADLGLVVDPDVDRLAFIDENGQLFGDEYTLVAVADYVLENYASFNVAARNKYDKATVSNLSSSRALREVTEKYQGRYEAAAVGEVNVVAKMKELKAVIGGEGNGGVIFPAAHYGRDSLVGSALFLSALARSGQKVSEFKKQFPVYVIIKDKMELPAGFNLTGLFERIKEQYVNEKMTEIDGLKIEWPETWVHLRASNTEPIVRLYGEARTEAAAAAKINEIKDIILAYIK